MLCHCLPQPEREGEVALFDPSSGLMAWILGREVEGGPARVHFFRQRPGEMTDTGPLTGNRISQEQLRIRVEGHVLHVTNVGNALVRVGGRDVPKQHYVLVGPGDVVEIFGHSVFVVALRPRAIPPATPSLLPLLPFGERCAMGFSGESPETWQLREDAEHAATTDGNVLVLGESGTGKEVTATCIHKHSKRAKGPFITPNCAEVTSALAAALFFGTRKNWPNPGTPETYGYFGDAVGGSLFLDEIGCLDKGVQATLLRALESGYSRVGESEVQRLACKVIGATNKGDASLAEDVLMRFGMVIRIPALRERPSDIAQVIRGILLAKAAKDATFAAAFMRYDDAHRPFFLLDASIVVNLLRHPLPGNVRQVEILLETAIRASRGMPAITWPANVPAPPPAQLVPMKEREEADVSIEALERALDRRMGIDVDREAELGEGSDGPGGRSALTRQAVAEELDRQRWHFGKTAMALGITEHQLYRLRRKYGLA